jgi:hypothetical protein
VASDHLSRTFIDELLKMDMSIHIISLTHPCYNFDTDIYCEEKVSICTVQQYPFVNNALQDYFTSNIRAQGGGLLVSKDNNRYDFVVADGIGFALAAQSFSHIHNSPLIYVQYGNDTCYDIDKWISNKSNYIINNKCAYNDLKNLFQLVM